MEQYVKDCEALEITIHVEHVQVPEVVPSRQIMIQLQKQLDTLIAAGDLKQNKRGTYVATRGWSSLNMKKPRSRGGHPHITISNMVDAMADAVKPVLDFLNHMILKDGYVPRGGEKFAHALRAHGFFEAVAVAVNYKDELRPHMDVENGFRHGYDVMGALTLSTPTFRIGVFGYTRRCVGHFLDWKEKNVTVGDS